MYYRVLKTALAFIVTAILSSGTTLLAVQIKVACVQMALHTNTQTNVDNTISNIQAEAALGTEVVVFPECSLLDYNCSVWAGINQTTINNAIGQVAAACDANNVYAIIGTPYYENGACYNAAVVIGPDGQIIHRYDKVHIVESCTTDGNELAMFRIKGEPATIFICHDERYPELMRIPAYAGAKIAFYISYESYDLSKEFNYRCQIVGRAVENQSWVVSCNAPMVSDSGDSHGQSRIIGPDGTVYAEAGRTETTIRYTIDTDQSSNVWAQASGTPPLLSEFWKEGLRVLQSQNLDYFGSVTADPSLLSNVGALGNSPNANIKVACAQTRMSSNINANVTNVISFIASEAAQGTRVVVLPECALTDRDPAILASINQFQIDAAVAQIADACRTYNVYAIVGSPFRDGGQLYNGAYVIDPGGNIIKRYAQLHTDLPGIFTDGSKMSLIKIDGMYATVLVGHDIHFPELSRIAVLAGAKVVFCLAYEASNTNLFASESQVVCRAVESQCFIVFCNAGTGNDAGNSTGHSRIVSPSGAANVEAGAGNNIAVRYTIDCSKAYYDYARAGFSTPSLQTYWQEGLDVIRRNNPEFYGDTEDTTPPGAVTGLTAAPGSAQNTLSWTNPTDPDFVGTRIMFKTTGYPSGPTDGTQCYSSAGTGFVHSGLTGGTTYYYKAFAYDGVPYYSSGAQVSATPAAGPPGNVTAFTAISGNGLVNLSWTNPGGSATGTKIVFKTTAYPSGPSDGTQVYDSSGTSCTHGGLTNGTTYYYTAFAHDGVPAYASGAEANAMPWGSAPTTVRIDFNGTKALTSSHYTEAAGIYASGLGQGNLGWNLSYTAGNAATSSRDMSWGATGDGTNGLVRIYDQNPGGSACMHVNMDVGEVYGDTTGYHMLRWGGLVMAKIKDYSSPGSSKNGFGYSSSDGNNSAVVCVRDGSVNVKTAVGNGGLAPAGVTNQNVWRVYALRWQAGGVCDVWISNGTDWSGSASGWTQLFSGATINNPQNAAADQNNDRLSGILLGSYGDNSDTCNLSVDWVAMTANTVPGTTFGVTPWQFDPTPDATPPGPVTNVKAYGGNGQVSLNWTNPTAGDFVATKILAKTTGYPTSQTDGTVVYNGTATSCVNSGLTNGTKYYYAAFAYDTSSNYSSAATITATAAADTTIPVARTLDDAQARALRGNIVTGTFTGYFYIQDPVCPWGIRASSTDSVSVGQKVDVVGSMAGTGAERYIDCTGNMVSVTHPGPISLNPVFLNTAVIGGSGFDAHAPGMVSGTGVYNVGLLVDVFGKVTQRQTAAPKYFYIDDGRGLLDGTTTSGVANVGVRIIADPANYAQGSFVIVKGVVSCFDSGGARPRILSVSVQTLHP
jgi:predicted amidohydrolase